MFTSIRSRLWWSYALVIAVVLFIIASALVIFLVRNPLLVRQTRDKLSLLSIVVLPRTEAIQNLPPEQLRRAVEGADQRFDVRVVVFGPNGSLLADSRSGTAPALPNLSRLLGNENRSFRDARGRVWLFDTIALTGGNTLLLAAPRPMLQLRAILSDEFLRPFFRAGLIALTLSLFLSFWIARWVAAPLQRIAKAAERVSEGEYQSIPLQGPDEVQELSRAFNEMTARVKASQQSQRDFVANISHELKTPLTSIQGFAQAILDGTAGKREEVHQAAEVILDEAGRVHRLVVELLDLARIDAGTVEFHRQQIDLFALLKGMVDKFQPQARQNHVQLLAEFDDLPPIVGDNDRLAQVFTNLLDNAIKFTPSGGHITLRARRINGLVEIVVEDSGPGLAPEELERVFERFYQADKSRPGGRGRGAGLGLTIAKEIVEAHQGEIYAQDNPDQGSVFVVKLPLDYVSRLDHRAVLQ